MNTSIRIRSAKPKIKSPFIKNQGAFPKDFFTNKDLSLKRQCSKNSIINTTLDNKIQSLNNTVISSSEKDVKRNSSQGFTRVFPSKNRKYRKATNSCSENRKPPIRISKLVNLDILKKQGGDATEQERHMLEISSKTKSVLQLSRNNSGLNCNYNKDGIIPIGSGRSSHFNNTQEVSTSALALGDGLEEDSVEIRRPVIKSKYQNYLRNSSNKSLLSHGNSRGINISELAKQRLKMCKNSDFKIPNQRCSQLKSAYRQKPQIKKYSSIYKTVNGDSRGNNTSMSIHHYDTNKSVLQANQIAYKNFRKKMLKIKSSQKLAPKRKTSKRLVKLKKLEKTQDQPLGISVKRLNPSSTMGGNCRKQNYHSNNLANQTIEYHEKTMIEEYTNASIPEFTLGPTSFSKNERPKPLSVNRMGFYEDCKDLEAKLSPIKQCQEVVKDNILNLNLEKVRKLPDGSLPDNKDSEENGFYDNTGLLSSPSTGKHDSTKKYIELVDSFRTGGRNIEFETPSFKIQTEETGGKKENMKLEDVLKKIKNTQRSYTLLNSLCRNSSEMQTQRKSSATRAETDAIDSFRPKSRRLKNSHMNLKKYHQEESAKEICIPDNIARLEGRNGSLGFN
ncbi:unnamed protein product [Moneuplotes crassus]|uniref:Uncharacterized protein n=1 Tax=Euplotes crassus TaxID=5936 RepID=A0AAD1YB09_EUPCR|nr:unnamed protein product [Moneuplotes crassus]